ncbi:MAG: Ig-like domain-containing protein [Candidatus Methanoperedens sp.]|nr:Ig-like domain-containing protein [Candidatus Methanoperedens sp.]
MMHINGERKIRNEEAVSPVIGVILMVVIVVIIAAIVAIFGFGVGGPVKTPTAKLDYETKTNGTNTSLCIYNNGGDSLVLSELTLTVKKAGQNGEIILSPMEMEAWNPQHYQYLEPGKRLCGEINNASQGDILSYQIMHTSTGQAVSDTSGTVVLGAPDTSSTGGSTGGSTATATATGTAAAPYLANIIVTPNGQAIPPGGTQLFSAAPKDQYGNAFTAAVTWSATGSGSIDSATGLFTAGSVAGAYTVTAASGSISGSASGTVSTAAPYLANIIVTPNGQAIPPGGTQLFSAAPKDQYGNAIAAAVTWSATGSGSVDSATGLFTAGSVAGAYTVTAANGSISGSASGIVTPLVLTTITVSPATATVVKGNTQAFTAAPKDQNGNSIAATITWASSNTTVGTISATGVLTAVSAGTTTVTASSGTVNGTASVTVTLLPAAAVSFNAPAGSGGQNTPTTTSSSSVIVEVWLTPAYSNYTVIINNTNAGNAVLNGHYELTVNLICGINTIPVVVKRTGYADVTTSVTITRTCAVTVTQSPTANSGAWTNPTRAYASDNSYATSNVANRQHIFSGYGFAIPSGATITQVRVRVDAYVSSNGNDNLNLAISSNSGAAFTNSGDINLDTSESTTWIDVTSLATWTFANINGNLIQTRITYIQSGYSADTENLDWIPIEVTYIPP